MIQSIMIYNAFQDIGVYTRHVACQHYDFSVCNVADIKKTIFALRIKVICLHLRKMRFLT